MKKIAFPILALLLLTLSCGEPSTPSVPIGQKGKLESGGAATPVATNEAALDAWTKARIANDDHGQKILLMTGQIKAIDKGTQILVIDHGEGMFKRKIRILEGEEKGLAGFVSESYIKPLH